MHILTDIPVNFNKSLLFSKLHIEETGEDADNFGRLIETATAIARPKAMFVADYIVSRTNSTVSIGEVTFASRALRVNTSKIERVFPFVATCGTELDTVQIPAHDMVKQYWLEEIKTEALKSATQHLYEVLKRQYGLPGVAGMSPGSGDIGVWPIEQQRPLFELLGDTKKEIGVALTDSFLMIPNKSVSGLAYASETTFESCRLCQRTKCLGRRAPFDQTLFRSLQE